MAYYDPGTNGQAVRDWFGSIFSPSKGIQSDYTPYGLLKKPIANASESLANTYKNNRAIASDPSLRSRAMSNFVTNGQSEIYRNEQALVDKINSMPKDVLPKKTGVDPKTTTPKVDKKLPTSPKNGNKVSLAKSGSGGAVDMDALNAAQAQQDYALGLSTPVPVSVNTVAAQVQPLDFDMSGNRGSLAFGGAYTDSAGNTVNAMPTGDNWWTQNKDMIGGIASGIQAGTGLANAYLGYKNYGLMKDQFNFAKAAANRDIANQAQLINNEIQTNGEIGMSLAGNTMSPEQRAVRQQQLNAMRVSGAPIG